MIDARPDLARASAVLPGATLGSFRLPDDLSFVAAEGSGTRVRTTDGREFVDFFLGAGPLILGHAHPEIVAAVSGQLGKGTHFAYLSQVAIELAETIVRLVPSAEAVKFAGDGTMATGYALRLARAATRRELVLKFVGGFHGSNDYALHDLRDGRVVPQSEGIPRAITDTVVMAPFNDALETERVVRKHANRLAAIIVEPIHRVFGPEPGFLRLLRTLADDTGALLIFDEIVTGFRVDIGGVQRLQGVLPDLTTLGKALGGGLPLAAVAGSHDLLALTVPGTRPEDRAVYFGNTLNGNPLSCAAGLASLEAIVRDDVPSRLQLVGGRAIAGLRETALDLGVPLQVLGVPAFFEPVFALDPVTSASDLAAIDPRPSYQFGLELIRRGILVYPGRKMYISAVHEGADVDRLVDTARDAMRAVRDRGLMPSR